MSGALVVNKNLEEAKKKLRGWWSGSENFNSYSARNYKWSYPLSGLSENVQKEELSNFVNKKVSEWMNQDEAVKSYAILNNSLKKDSRFDYLEDQNVIQAQNDVFNSWENLEDVKNKARDFSSWLRKSWESSVKKDLDSLGKLSWDTRYMGYLASIWLDPNTIMRLWAWQESYVDNFSAEVRKNFNDDVKRMDSLDRIKEEARRDYQLKVKTLRNEIDRVQNNQDKIIKSGYDKSGNFLAVRQDGNTGQLYYDRLSDPEIKFSDRDVYGKSGSSYDNSSTFSKYWLEDYNKNLSVKNLRSTDEILATTENFKWDWSKKLKRWQCWEFANDLLGISGLFKDKKEDKLSVINSKEPVVWWAFISSSGKYWHVGIVEKILGDWSLQIIDSNKNWDEKVNRRIITPHKENIKWYFDPKKFLEKNNENINSK